MKQVLVSEELLRQVIEVLEQADERDGVYSYRCEIDALRAALEKPAQKTCGRCVVFCQGGEGCHCNAPQISQRGRERLVSDQLNRRPAVEPTCKPPLQVHKPTGWVAHKDQYAVSVLFNPYTGEPRDVRDVQSDPQGILIVPPGKVEMLAAKPAPVQVQQKMGKEYIDRLIDSLLLPMGAMSASDVAELHNQCAQMLLLCSKAQPRKAAVKLSENELLLVLKDAYESSSSQQVEAFLHGARLVEAAVFAKNGWTE